MEMVELIKYDTVRFWVTNGYFTIGKEVILSINLNDVTLNLQQDFHEAGLSKSYKSQQSNIIFSNEIEIIECSTKFRGYDLTQILEKNKIYDASFYLNSENVFHIEIHDLGNEHQTQEIRVEDKCCVVATSINLGEDF